MKRYGAWAGEPSGRLEDPKYCVVEVPMGGRSCLFRQCARLRTRPEGLCAVHDKKRREGKRLDIPDEAKP